MKKKIIKRNENTQLAPVKQKPPVKAESVSIVKIVKGWIRENSLDLTMFFAEVAVDLADGHIALSTGEVIFTLSVTLFLLAKQLKQ